MRNPPHPTTRGLSSRTSIWTTSGDSTSIPPKVRGAASSLGTSGKIRSASLRAVWMTRCVQPCRSNVRGCKGASMRMHQGGWLCASCPLASTAPGSGPTPSASEALSSKKARHTGSLVRPRRSLHHPHLPHQFIVTVPFICPVRIKSILLNAGRGDFAPRVSVVERKPRLCAPTPPPFSNISIELETHIIDYLIRRGLPTRSHLFLLFRPALSDSEPTSTDQTA